MEPNVQGCDQRAHPDFPPLRWRFQSTLNHQVHACLAHEQLAGFSRWLCWPSFWPCSRPRAERAEAAEEEDFHYYRPGRSKWRLQVHADPRDRHAAGLEGREYFMGDLAAVVRGLRDGGATEIVAYDGHGNQAFLPELMVKGAKYATGQPKPNLWGLDATFDGVVMLGYHAMMGTPDGVLNHTQSSKTENRYWYNGVESGELVQDGAVAGHYGVPPILVTGDEAVCREARRFYGDACITVAVKQGISREAAALYPFAETRNALYEGAETRHGRAAEVQALHTPLPGSRKAAILGV